MFGNGALPEEVRGELRTILLQMRNERNACEAVAGEAKASLERAEGLNEPVRNIEQSLAQLESRLQSVERLASRVSTLSEQAETLAGGQTEVGSQLTECEGRVTTIRSDVAGLQEEIRTLQQVAREASALKPDMAQLHTLGEHLKSLRGEVGACSGEIGQLRATFTTTRDQQDEIRQRGVAAMSHLAAMEERYDHVSTGFRTIDERASKLEGTVDALAELAAGVPDVRRELSTLKALADYVAQKISEIEQQREAVDHATSRGERFAELLSRIDRDTKTQLENAKFLAHMQEEIERLRVIHVDLLEQSDTIATRQVEIAATDESRRQELTELRDALCDDIRQATDRFEFERQGLDTTATQVADLRHALAEMERRFRSLDEAAGTVTEIQTEVAQLAERVGEIGGEVAQLDAHAGRLPTVAAGIHRAERSIEDLFGRLDEVREPAMTSLDEAEERLADLNTDMQSLEARSRELQGFADRIRVHAREAEQRESSIERTLARLDHLAALREDAAAKVDALTERSQELTESLATTGEQLTQVQELCDQLDRKTVDLQKVSEDITQFEQRLAKWQATEAMVSHALENATQRQATIDALKGEIHRMFEIAQRTTDNVRAIVGAREELSDSRGTLEGIVAEIRAVRQEADRLDARRREMSEIDQQIARAEALMIDMGSTLSTLHGQKAFLDQVMETAGSLRFQAKQAEALIAAMRDGQIQIVAAAEQE
jgi:chromosome segregation ATPase